MPIIRTFALLAAASLTLGACAYGDVSTYVPPAPVPPPQTVNPPSIDPMPSAPAVTPAVSSPVAPQ